MASPGYGILQRIDGPLPLAPLYGLLQAAAAPGAGVSLVTDTDADGLERWINGVELYSYPVDVPGVFDPCATGTSPAATKGFGSALPHPQFGAMTVHLDETCPSLNVPNQEAYKARAVTAFAAVESAGVADEFLSGAGMPLNPHLSDGNGVFPNGDTLTSVANGIALLEDVIAASGKLGLIHCSPGVATIARERFAIDVRDRVIRTINGNVVIPDAGYVGSANPKPTNGVPHTKATGTQEWIYASGPVEVRRSEIFVLPEKLSEALDRGMGATGGRTNSITYRAERFYLVDWDTAVQAAVRVDRCLTTCT